MTAPGTGFRACQMLFRQLMSTRVLTCCLCVAVCCAPAPARGSVPVPGPAAQAKALAAVKATFAAEYRKTRRQDRVDLAAQLLHQVAEPGNDDAARYVLLREARDIAAAAGDVATALAAVDVAAVVFEGIDPVALKLEALSIASK